MAGIEPAATIVIGDAVYDMQMAAAAGARSIGVSWGYGPPAPWPFTAPLPWLTGPTRFRH